jgi:hypothetical protein
MECRFTGKTEVLGENLLQRHFCPSQNLTWSDPGLNPSRRGGKAATNRLSYGAAIPAPLVSWGSRRYLWNVSTERFDWNVLAFITYEFNNTYVSYYCLIIEIFSSIKKMIPVFKTWKTWNKLSFTIATWMLELTFHSLCNYQQLCVSCLNRRKKLSSKADESFLRFIHIQGATSPPVAFFLSLSAALISQLAHALSIFHRQFANNWSVDIKLVFKIEGLRKNTGRKHYNEPLCIVVINGLLFIRLYKAVPVSKYYEGE